MKYCPTCGYETADDESNLCPICDEEVKLVEKKDDRANMSTKESNKSMEVKGVASGGNTTIIDNSKHVERPLSEAERIAKNKAAYREDCENRCKDGFVSEEDLDYLERQRESLGLERHIAAEILKQAKERSIRKVVKLPDAARIQLNQTRDAIGINDMQSIRHDFDALKQWKTKLDIDELNQLYFQLKSILEPNTFEFEDNEYWSVFWSAVAFKKTGSPNVVESIASLNRWDSFYPQQNQNLISTVSLLMDNRLKEATESFKAITKGFSPDLQSVYDTLDSMLGREWRSENIDVATRLKFYSDSLFKNAYDFLRETAKKKQADDIANEEAEKRRKAEESYRREKFLEIFESNGGNIDTACFASGLPKVKYIEWLETIPEFAQSVKTVQERIAKAIKDQEEAAADAERLAKEIANKKELFKKGYKDNQCDLNKTCYGLGIDSGTVRSWRSSDASFDEALKFIERQNLEDIEEERKRKEALLLEEEAKKRAERMKECKRKLRKILPYVIVCILLLLIGIGILQRTRINRVNRQKEAFIDNLKSNGGNIDEAYYSIGINTIDYQEWSNDDPKFAGTVKLILKDIREQQVSDSLALIHAQDSLRTAAISDSLNNVAKQKAEIAAAGKQRIKSNKLIYIEVEATDNDGKRLNYVPSLIKNGINNQFATSKDEALYIATIKGSIDKTQFSEVGSMYFSFANLEVSIKDRFDTSHNYHKSFSSVKGRGATTESEAIKNAFRAACEQSYESINQYLK